MTAIVECVPNFSEGRDQRVLDALREAITSAPGVRLLDVQADAAHHRSVFTFIGAPAAASAPAIARPASEARATATSTGWPRSAWSDPR